MTDDPRPTGPSAPSGPTTAPTGQPPVQYKGADLEAARGPGLGCFWIQVAVLAVLIVATPLSVSVGAPEWLSAALLFTTIGLLLLTGQTIIFLLRLVAADRRAGRRRPMAARTPTVGELEDAAAPAGREEPEPPGEPEPSGEPEPPTSSDPPPTDPVRQ